MASPQQEPRRLAGHALSVQRFHPGDKPESIVECKCGAFLSYRRVTMREAKDWYRKHLALASRHARRTEEPKHRFEPCEHKPDICAYCNHHRSFDMHIGHARRTER